jgi:hypoxanthine phosphoribosyltransferase
VGDYDVLFIDDWVDTGETVGRFYQAANSVGVESGRIAVATLCGEQLPGITHVVGSNQMAKNSEWNAYEEITGIEVVDRDASLVRASRNQHSATARQLLTHVVAQQQPIAS